MIAGISEWLLSLPDWVALLAVFLGPALESSAFFGFIFPGEIAVFVGGVLAFEGRVELGPVMVAAVVGAIVGDTVGYWVGREYGRRLLRFLFGRIPFVGRHLDRHLDSAQAYLQRKGGRAVFFGRYTAALRVLVPGLAGMSGMHYPKFLFWNVTGGATWAILFVLLGYFAGEAWQKVEAYAGRAGIGLLVLIVVAFLVVRLARRTRKDPERAREREQRILASRPVAWFRRRLPRPSAWLGRRFDPASPMGLRLTTVAAVGAFCAYAFVALTQDVAEHTEVTHLDPGVERFFVGHRAATVTALMRSVTWLGSSVVIAPLVVIVGGWILVRARNWRPGASLFAAYAGALALYSVLKPAVERPRPPLSHMLVHVSGFAFPSGHATMSMAFYGTLAGVLWNGRSRIARVLLWSAASVVVLVVGASRLYLGAHWLTDVLGGYALGGLWVCVLVAVILVASARRAPGPEPPPGPGPAAPVESRSAVDP